MPEPRSQAETLSILTDLVQRHDDNFAKHNQQMESMQQSIKDLQISMAKIGKNLALLWINGEGVDQWRPAEISYFSGEGVDQWLHQIECFFIRYQTAPEQKFVVAVPYLSGEAMEWYRQMWLARRLSTWDNFAADLRCRFWRIEAANKAVSMDEKLDRMIARLEKTMPTPNSESEPESCVPVETDMVDKSIDVPIKSDSAVATGVVDEYPKEDHDSLEAHTIVDQSVVVDSAQTQVTFNHLSSETSLDFVLNKFEVDDWKETQGFAKPVYAPSCYISKCSPIVCENASMNLPTMADAMLVKPPAKPPDSLKSASKLVIMNYIIDKSLIYERILVIARVPKEWDKSFQDVKKMRNRGVFYGRHFYNVMIDSYGKYKYLNHALTAVNIMRSKEESNFLPTLMLFGDLSFYVSIFDLVALCKCDGTVEMIKSIYDPLIRNRGLPLVIMSNGKKVGVATEFLGQDGCEMQGERLTLDKPPPLPPDIIFTHPLWRCGKVKEWTDMTICWDVKGFDKGCFKGNLARVLDYIWVVEDGVAVQDYGIQICANGQCTQVSFVTTPYKHVILHDLCGVLVKDRPESVLFSPVGSQLAITNWILRLPEVLFIDFSSLFVSRIFDVARGIAELGFGTLRVIRFSNGKGPGLDAFIVFIGIAFDMYYNNHLKLLRLGMSFDMLVMLPAKLPYSWQIAFGYHVHSVILSVVMCLKLSRSSSDFCALTNGSNDAALLINVWTAMTCASTFIFGVFEVSMGLCNCALFIRTCDDFELLILGLDWRFLWSYNWSLVVSDKWFDKLTRKSREVFDHCTMDTMLGHPSMRLFRGRPSQFLFKGNVLNADVISTFIDTLSKYLLVQIVSIYQPQNAAELFNFSEHKDESLHLHIDGWYPTEQHLHLRVAMAFALHQNGLSNVFTSYTMIQVCSKSWMFAALSKLEAEVGFINELIALVIVKKRNDEVQGTDVHPVVQQMLTHQGNLLKDGTISEENKVFLQPRNAGERSTTTTTASGVDTTAGIKCHLLFWFSSPRPPELTDLEDKVIFKGRGMLHMRILENLRGALVLGENFFSIKQV